MLPNGYEHTEFNDRVRGDDKELPNRGTSTGVADNAATCGMSIDSNANNTLRSITEATQSTPWQQDMPPGE